MEKPTHHHSGNVHVIYHLKSKKKKKKNISLTLLSIYSLSTSGDSGTISDSVSGKSSPANFSDHTAENGHSIQHDVDKQQNKANLEKNSFDSKFGTAVSVNAEINTNCHPLTSSISSSNNAIDTSSRFSKLGLFDDNNSFFSTNTFQPSPFFKLDSTPTTTQLRNLDSNHQTISPQLPDLLSGTESDKERHDLQEKLNLLKGLSDYSSNGLQNGFGSGSGLDELQKRRNMGNGLGLHSTGLIGSKHDITTHTHTTKNHSLWPI